MGIFSDRPRSASGPGAAADQYWPAFGTKGATDPRRSGRSTSREGRAFEIIVIGGGPLREPIEERIRQLGLCDSVKLVGWRTGSEVKQELLNSRGLVLPSFAEGLPVVIMESLALGRPVISTYIAGIPELVTPGENGWLVPAGDVEELAAAMAKMLDAPVGELERMGRAGAERVARHHDVRIEARKLLDLIERSA